MPTNVWRGALKDVVLFREFMPIFSYENNRFKISLLDAAKEIKLYKNKIVA